MKATLSCSSDALGPSGLNVHTSVCVAVSLAGNGDSTNGSNGTPTKPGRKRMRRPQQWKRHVAKLKRTRGEEYVSPSTGKTVSSVCMGSPCKCRKKCFDLFTDTEQEGIFESFYSLATKNLQDSHLFGLITSKPVKRRRPRKQASATSRQAVYTYEVSKF